MSRPSEMKRNSKRASRRCEESERKGEELSNTRLNKKNVE
jgi:hypothetical protein